MMMFYRTALNLKRFPTEDPLVVKKGENNHESIITLDVWKHSNFLYKNYIRNELDNILYGVYSVMKSAKKLWNSLERNTNKGC